MHILGDGDSRRAAAQQPANLMVACMWSTLSVPGVCFDSKVAPIRHAGREVRGRRSLKPRYARHAVRPGYGRPVVEEKDKCAFSFPDAHATLIKVGGHPGRRNAGGGYALIFFDEQL